jgi:hypothetical protein
MSGSGATLVEIFTSYSHRDAKFVELMVKFLRPARAGVFWDKDGIPFGKKWAVVITAAIESCRVMYLFWCSHSAKSREVKREYETAIRLNKDVVPILMDGTPLPKKLKQFQFIDFRYLIERQHKETVEQEISLEEGRRRQREGPGIIILNGQWVTGGAARFWREGWREQGDKYVRRVDFDLEPTKDAVRKGAALWSRNLESHMGLRRRSRRQSQHGPGRAKMPRSA